jgi:signal transduction histidine kinase
LRRHDGTFRWHVCRAVPERSADGIVEAWLGTYSDFEDLKQAIQARDEFLVIASHELRTPLTALKLRLQAVLRDVTLDEKPRSGVQRALRQAERLERLIVNLLDVSRITTGNLQIEPEPIDLVDLVRETVERFGDQLAQYSTRIDLSGESSLRGEWDRMRIEQVVTNLLSNAVRYSEGKPINVHVSATEDGAEVSVKDAGPGIAEADLERIFQRFERTATPHDRAGLGVGLFIARRIVERHGGALNAYSTPGSGAEFRMTLPRRHAGDGNGSFGGAFRGA